MLSGLEQREESVPCVELYLEWKCLSSLMCQAVDNVQILIDMLTLQRIFEEHSSYRNHKLVVGRWGLEIIEKLVFACHRGGLMDHSLCWYFLQV